jgi:hypothetical protein
MTLTFPVPYLASADSRRFNRRQSRAQQQRALRTLTVSHDPLFGLGGQLAQLREAIKNRGEKIPGRTSDESLEMVEQQVSEAFAVMKMMDHDRMMRLIPKYVSGAVCIVLLVLLLNVKPIVGFLVEFLGSYV